ncbi:hypothetical protein R1flu_007621 [Riccia fluitans]|uniref:Uncharacterized protein n=1 Tax=Riccia fluitans TaxID=41844 RepID=A0ABD1Z3J3_9MARC
MTARKNEGNSHCTKVRCGMRGGTLFVINSNTSDGESLKTAIAEVTNTPWGERVKFEFEPSKDKVAKLLPVSPLMDMAGSWLMYASPPGEKMTVTIGVEHPEFGKFFVASLGLKKVQSVANPESFFWLMPHKVAVWIYWHAMLLLWKGVGFVQHPKYVDGDAYRERAQLRDGEQLKASHASSSSCSLHSELSAMDEGNTLMKSNRDSPWSQHRKGNRTCTLDCACGLCIVMEDCSCTGN